jgi:hypothetical protein
MTTTQSHPMNPQHTPTPWRTTEGSYGNYVAIIDANGKTVARIPWGEGDGHNAAFIVRAVNNHENLIGQLYECAELLEQAKRYADKSGDVGMAAFYASGADQARAALASAQS